MNPGKLKNLKLPGSLFIPLPCLPIIVLFLSTSIPVGLIALHSVSQTGGYLLLVIFPILAGLILPISIRKWFAWTGLGLLLTSFHVNMPWATYKVFLPRSELYVEIKAIVSDNKLIDGDELEWVEHRNRVEISACQIRLSKHEQWQHCSGKILLLNRNKVLKYQEKIHVRGRLVLPRKNVMPGMFEYSNYLKIKGIEHLLIPLDINSKGVDDKGIKWLLMILNDARTQVLYHITNTVSNIDNKTVLASLTFGIKPNFSPRQRLKYIQSGMLHLFAISGLHIGILFSIIFCLLNVTGITQSAKYFITPMLLLFYVMMTGASPSAVRAWVMISVWAMSKGFKLPVVTLNTLLFSAILLLIYNPLYIFHSGFQFSYILVFCLVVGWQKSRPVIGYLNELRLWSVNRNQRHFFSVFTIRTFLLRALVSMTCVWLGSIGLTGHYNGLILPTTIITNIVVCILAWVIIFASIIKFFISLFGISWLNCLIGSFLSINLDAIRLISNLSSDYGWVITIERFSFLATLLYYVVLLMVLTLPKTFKQISIFILVLALCLSSVVIGNSILYRKPQIHVFLPEGSIVPVILTIPGGRNEPVIINTGTRDFGFKLKSMLNAKGVKRIDKVVVLDNRSDYLNGLSKLDQFHIGSIIVCNSDRRNMTKVKLPGWQSQAKIRLFHKQNAVYLNNDLIVVNKSKQTNEFKYRFVCDSLWQIDISLMVRKNSNSTLHIVMTNQKSGNILDEEWSFIYNNKDIWRALQ